MRDYLLVPASSPPSLAPTSLHRSGLKRGLRPGEGSWGPLLVLPIPCSSLLEFLGSILFSFLFFFPLSLAERLFFWVLQQGTPLLTTTRQPTGASWGNQHPSSAPGATAEARRASHVLRPNRWNSPSLESGSHQHKRQAALEGGVTCAVAGGAETLPDPTDPAAARAPADFCLRCVFAANKQRDGKADGLYICQSAFLRKPLAVQMPGCWFCFLCPSSAAFWLERFKVLLEAFLSSSNFPRRMLLRISLF